MPDLVMCDSKICPLKTQCYRNPASGTKPSEFQQAWFLGVGKEGDECPEYWSVDDRKWPTAAIRRLVAHHLEAIKKLESTTND